MPPTQTPLVIGPDAVLDASGIAVWIAHDPHGERISANRVAKEWLRVPVAAGGELPECNEPPPTFFSGGEALPPDQQPLRRCLLEGIAIEGLELTLRNALGESICVDARATPLHDSSGRVCGAVLACSDVTRWRNALDAARHADRRKDEFLAHLGHDLRNPLAPIRTAVQLLRMPGVEPERVKDLLDVTERQVMHMARLIDQMMDLGQLSLGGLALNWESVDLSAVIDDAIGASSSLIGAAGHHLDLRLPDAPMRLQADSARLAQAISNVIENAAKFTDRGGRIEVSAKRRGNVGVVRIRDNGYGIAPDFLPTMFEPYTRGSQQSRHAANGLGIGLTLSRSLIALHSGTIEAHSEGEGKGSEVVITLPLAA